MTTLHLGVEDIPYSWGGTSSPAKARKTAGARQGGAAKARSAKPDTTTTGEVAEILEAKYRVMFLFTEEYPDEIANAVANGYAGAMETVMMGGPVPADPLAGAASEIEESFKYFLSSAEIEGFGVAGVPTQAALDGVNHRLKIKKGPRRPSFIDTGLYQASFKAWFVYR